MRVPARVMPMPEGGVARSVMRTADRGVMAVMAPATIAAASVIAVASGKGSANDLAKLIPLRHGGRRIKKASKDD
jgi:hypothetical protein